MTEVIKTCSNCQNTISESLYCCRGCGDKKSKWVESYYLAKKRLQVELKKVTRERNTAIMQINRQVNRLERKLNREKK